MDKITIDAYGKINLSLDVLRGKDNGYHELRMIMQQIDLKDIITIEEIEEERVIIESNNKNDEAQCSQPPVKPVWTNGIHHNCRY